MVRHELRVVLMVQLLLADLLLLLLVCRGRLLDARGHGRTVVHVNKLLLLLLVMSGLLLLVELLLLELVLLKVLLLLLRLKLVLLLLAVIIGRGRRVIVVACRGV